jgi:hypothetical protein
MTDRSSCSVTMSDSPTNNTQQALKWCGRIVAVLAAAFIILAREGVGPPYFDAAGKALFWTGIVFVPLLSLNQDVLRLAEGKLLVVALFVLHLVFVLSSFGRLKNFTFITLTPLCFGQCLLFAVPFMLVRKRLRLIDSLCWL